MVVGGQRRVGESLVGAQGAGAAGAVYCSECDGLAQERRFFFAFCGAARGNGPRRDERNSWDVVADRRPRVNQALGGFWHLVFFYIANDSITTNKNK